MANGKNTKVIGGITYTKFAFASGGYKFISPKSAANRELAATLKEYNKAAIACGKKAVDWNKWKAMNA